MPNAGMFVNKCQLAETNVSKNLLDGVFLYSTFGLIQKFHSPWTQKYAYQQLTRSSLHWR
ncbi:MAG: hypothetical protein ABSH41_24940 [Syntrophobacteraceae bacterium]